MKVTLERSGGVANMKFAGRMDTESDSTPTISAQKLQFLVDQIDFGSKDQFRYTITVDTDDGLVLTLEGVPENLVRMIKPLKELVELLTVNGLKPVGMATASDPILTTVDRAIRRAPDAGSFTEWYDSVEDGTDSLHHGDNNPHSDW